MVLVTNAATLTQHPARQGVMDFLRVIVLDSMTLNFSGKATPVSTGVFIIGVVSVCGTLEILTSRNNIECFICYF